MKNFPRSPAALATNQRAMYWQSPEGLNSWPYVYANKWMFEDKLEPNAPRWARAYALIAASLFDAFIASQDGKFTYWYIRRLNWSRQSFPCFPFPISRAIHRTIPRSRPPDRRCWLISFHSERSSFGEWGRRPEIRASGRGYTIRSITRPVWRWAKRSWRNS